MHSKIPKKVKTPLYFTSRYLSGDMSRGGKMWRENEEKSLNGKMLRALDFFKPPPQSFSYSPILHNMSTAHEGRNALKWSGSTACRQIHFLGVSKYILSSKNKKTFYNVVIFRGLIVRTYEQIHSRVISHKNVIYIDDFWVANIENKMFQRTIRFDNWLLDKISSMSQ